MDNKMIRVFFLSAHHFFFKVQKRVCPLHAVIQVEARPRMEWPRLAIKAWEYFVSDVSEGVVELLAVLRLVLKFSHLKWSELSLHFIQEVLNGAGTWGALRPISQQFVGALTLLCWPLKFQCKSVRPNSKFITLILCAFYSADINKRPDFYEPFKSDV